MDKNSPFTGSGHRLGYAPPSSSMAPLPYRSRPGRKSSSASQPSALPQQIRDDINQLQQYMKKVWETACCGCKANITSEIDIKQTIHRWFDKSNSESGDTSISSRKCRKCAAVTCLGCGEIAREGRPRKLNDHYMSWCCLDGRLVTIWMMLCRFDSMEIEQRALRQKSRRSSQAQAPGTTTSGVAGVGYAADRTNLWPTRIREPLNARSNTPIMRLREEDPRMDDFISWIMDVLALTIPGPSSKDFPPVIVAMLELSLLIDKAAELLRNDSLDDIMKRSTVYRSILDLVEKVGAHRMLLRLLQEDRFSKTWSSGLNNLSFPTDSNNLAKTPQQMLVLANDGKDQSLAKRLENLAIQSKLILGVSGSNPDLRCLCQQISFVYKSIVTNEVPESTATLPEDRWSNFHKAYSLTFNDAIRTDFLTELRVKSAQIERQLDYSWTITDRNKRILSECANMRTSLDNGTFVVVADTRPDMMKALMIGPEDTPYANGLFEFDILLPADYPRSPPKIYIKLPYPIMININLHPDGKVCLSLLGTYYAGDTTENWQPGISTILQCLLSIRAMILISNSLDQNAPVDMSTSPSQAASFDRGVQAQTIWFFMLNWLVDTVKRNGFWKSIVEKHFTARREEILCTVKRWAWQNPDLRHWSGHLARDCVPKLGPMTEYIPGFHGRRTVDLVQQLEQHLPAPKTA